MRIQLLLLFILFMAGKMLASPPCDTILLKNGKKIPARAIVVTASEVRYQQCADTGNVEFGFPIAYVSGVISGTEFRLVSPDGLGPAAATASTPASGGAPGRTWVFLRKTDLAERRIAHNQRIQVRVRSPNGSSRTQEGRLQDISADTLYLAGRQQVVHGIAMKDIVRIKLMNPNGRPYGLFALIAFIILASIGVGLIFIAWFLVTLISAITGTKRDPDAREGLRPLYQVGAIYLIVALVPAIWYMAVGLPKTIPNPATEWTLKIAPEAPAATEEQRVP